MDDLVGIGPDPLDPAAISALVTTPDNAEGAIVLFNGTVRAQNAGRNVLYLEYEAFEELAVRVFRMILEEASVNWPSVRLALRHRVGRLMPGETSIVIAAGSAHRADAFSACRYAIERVKQVAPVWKREFFEGGDVWIEGAVADPNDEAARERALNCAKC